MILLFEFLFSRLLLLDFYLVLFLFLNEFFFLEYELRSNVFVLYEERSQMGHAVKDMYASSTILTRWFEKPNILAIVHFVRELARL